ncbi:hypothetical protein EJB05_41089, partial [Eragrostis curvula]
MMVMGYFRSAKSSATSPRKAKKNGGAPAEAGLRESLLEQPAAAAAEGGVPKGYFAVYVGEESRRFVVPTGYLQEPAFRDLMERAADEFGFAQAGGLRVPCAEDDFEDLLRRLQRKNSGAAAGKGKKKTVRAIEENPLSGVDCAFQLWRTLDSVAYLKANASSRAALPMSCREKKENNHDKQQQDQSLN